MEKKIGLTKDAGWQFGLRKTVPLKVNETWELLFSEDVAKLWLKDAKKEFSTFKPYSHIRTKWKLKGWTHEATLQMRVLPNKDKTTIAFHLDKLLNENQRDETKAYWDEIINNIIKRITEKATNS